MTPTEALTTIKEFVSSEFDLDVLPNVNAAFDELSTALTNTPDSDATDATSLPGYGKKIGFADRNGKALRIGDVVEFTDSNRYGTGDAIVVGVGDHDSAYKHRPKLKLLSGENDAYEPSASRVKRVKKAQKPVTDKTDTSTDEAIS